MGSRREFGGAGWNFGCAGWNFGGPGFYFGGSGFVISVDLVGFSAIQIVSLVVLVVWL